MKILLLILLIFSPLQAAPDEGANTAYLRATYFLQSGQLEKAVEELNQALKLDPDSGHLLTVYGRTQLALGNVEDGRSALEQATRLDPQSGDAFKTLGLLLFRELAAGNGDDQKAERALDLLNTAADLNETDLESRYYLAFLYEEQGKIEESYQRLREAVQIDNSRPELLTKAAETAEKLEKPRDAAMYYERASLYLEKLATRLKDNLNIQFDLGRTSLWDTQKYDVARTAYERVIDATENDMSMTAYRIEAEIGKATALYFMEDYEPATALFEKNEQFVFTRYPRSIAPMLLTYSQIEKTERALELAEMIIEEVATNELFKDFVLRLKGVILADDKRFEDAADIFEQSIAAFPDEHYAYLQYAQMWIEEEKFDKADQVLDRAEEQFGKDYPEVLFTRAIAVEEQGDFDGAVKLLERVIEIDPDNDLALNFLGYMYAENNKNLEKAEQYLLDALELSPNQGSYLDSLGWVYFQMGNMDLAEKYLKKAYRTKYRTAEVREHLGYLYLELGKRQLALQEFEAALELGLEEVKDTGDVEEQIRVIREELDTF